MTEYVVGLAFSEDKDRVVLIKKNRGPECLIGKWNGVGGHVEDTELPLAAMVREFKEETGVSTAQEEWSEFLVLHGNGWVVHFFHAFSTVMVATARTAEDEVIGPWHVPWLPETLAPNLRWIIPMALGHLNEHVVRYEVTEAEVTA